MPTESPILSVLQKVMQMSKHIGDGCDCAVSHMIFFKIFATYLKYSNLVSKKFAFFSRNYSRTWIEQAGD